MCTRHAIKEIFPEFADFLNVHVLKYVKQNLLVLLCKLFLNLPSYCALLTGNKNMFNMRLKIAVNIYLCGELATPLLTVKPVGVYFTTLVQYLYIL